MLEIGCRQMTLEQVEGNVAKNSKVFGRVIQAHAGGVFSKGQVFGVMESILNGPMHAGSVKVMLGSDSGCPNIPL